MLLYQFYWLAILTLFDSDINFLTYYWSIPTDSLLKVNLRVNAAQDVEMFCLNTIEQLFLFAEQLDQLEVCLAYSRLLAGIPILAVFQNLRWNSNKTSLFK